MAHEYVTKIAQYPAEAEWFEQLIRDNNVRSYLEIGGRHGGSLWRYGGALPLGSRLVSVDMPIGKTLPHLEQCAAALKDAGYDVHLIIGDSRSAEIVGRVKELGPYDLLLIDGDHSFETVQKDWDHYSPMARIVALHDIAWKRPPDWKEGRRIHVPEFWQQIKRVFARTDEVRLDPTGQDNGIGVIWRS